MRLKILLAYDGGAYCGWQIQEKPNAPPTIQGAVEAALFAVLRRNIRIYGAGRTDSGVHAFGQVAHFDVESTRQNLELDWRKTLNSQLPGDIRILSAEIVQDNFHARKDAFSKTYVYNFWTDAAFIPPHLAKYAWNCGILDFSAMRNALPFFYGEHGFASFQNAGSTTKTDVRTVFDIRLEELPAVNWFPAHLPMLRLVVTANGFLKQMVRNMAGFIMYVGKGKTCAAELPHIIAARDRRALPSPTAPAAGLSLARVYYHKAALAGMGIQVY